MRINPLLFNCQVNEYIDLEWTISNEKDNNVVLVLRVLAIQKGLEQINHIEQSKNCKSVSDLVIWTGSTERLVRLDKGTSKTIKMKVIITSIAKIQFLCHAEEVGVTLSETVVVKSKYEPPTLILGNLEKMHWAGSIEVSAEES